MHPSRAGPRRGATPLSTRNGRDAQELGGAPGAGPPRGAPGIRVLEPGGRMVLLPWLPSTLPPTASGPPTRISPRRGPVACAGPVCSTADTPWSSSYCRGPVRGAPSAPAARRSSGPRRGGTARHCARWHHPCAPPAVPRSRRRLGQRSRASSASGSISKREPGFAWRPARRIAAAAMVVFVRRAFVVEYRGAAAPVGEP